jgi:HAD superfamily hydrolase (TIGR01549 family)
MTLKAVLFDLDDTLYDHQYGSRTALTALYDGYTCFQQTPFAELERQHSDLLEHYHLRVLSGEMTLDQARFARFSDLLACYAGESSLVDEVWKRYRKTYLASEQLVSGAVALLERLREEGLKIGLVTNNTVAEQTGKLKRLGLESLIDVLVISEAAGFPKPDPRIFALALEQLGCAPDETIMIGDSWSADIAGARAAGIRAIWLNRSGHVCPDATLAAEIHALEPLETVIHLISQPTFTIK